MDRKTFLRLLGISIITLFIPISFFRNSNLRTTYLVIDNEEIKIPSMKYIRKGDRFKLVNPDGTVIEVDGKTVFLAHTNASKNEDGIWGVVAD
jgi:hypothetical protein